MIKICMNGGISKVQFPYTPTTLEEYVREISWFMDRGIKEFHIHFCDAAGKESLIQEIIEPQFAQLKQLFPQCHIGIGTPLQNGMTDAKRQKLIRPWTWKPDYISLNLSEPGHKAMSDLFIQKQIPVEYSIFTMEDAHTFEKYNYADVAFRVLIEIYNAVSNEDALGRAREILDFFQKRHPDIEFVVHGTGKYTWTILRYARENEYNYRIGLEDTQVDETGQPILTNQVLFEHIYF